MLLKLKYNLIITIILAIIIMLTGLMAYAQEADLREGEGAKVSAPQAPQLPAPQGESANELIVPADEKGPMISEITESAGGEITQETVKKSGGVTVEERIFQLEKKINYLAYLNMALFLFIVIVASFVVIIRIKKKNFSKLDI